MNELANQILEFFRSLSLAEASFWLFVQNIVQLILCLAGGQLVKTIFQEKLVGDAPGPLERKELFLAAGCVFLNTAFAVAGWFLWKNGLIVIRQNVSALEMFFDVAVLLLMMDFLMYLSHRICHHRIFFSWVHATHHLYDNPRPLSLFVLNPLEVLGFGSLWLVILMVYHASWLAIVVYLLLNALWGTIGHLGVEPLPSKWPSFPLIGRLTTSTFHAQHHLGKNHNFGFYTDIWDRVFNSVKESYRTTLE